MITAESILLITEWTVSNKDFYCPVDEVLNHCCGFTLEPQEKLGKNVFRQKLIYYPYPDTFYWCIPKSNSDTKLYVSLNFLSSYLLKSICLPISREIAPYYNDIHDLVQQSLKLRLMNQFK